MFHNQVEKGKKKLFLVKQILLDKIIRMISYVGDVNKLL